MDVSSTGVPLPYTEWTCNPKGFLLPDPQSSHVRVPDPGLLPELLGEHDAHLRAVESAYPEVRIVARGDEVTFDGDPDQSLRARSVIAELVNLLETGHSVDIDRVRRVIEMVDEGVENPGQVFTTGVPVSPGRIIRPKTVGQRRYVEAIRSNTLVFGIGPAGTGKTYLAMAVAIEALAAGTVRRLVLTRPAVEAGERLGFLPGDLTQKIDPYLRPLYDALYDMVGPELTAEYLERGIIEIAPLAFMRGRTLNDSFVILDEAQNTSPEQMKMVLTRLGFNSKMVITGDVTQVDLPTGKGSGLRVVRSILDDIDDITFIDLTARDVVRARLVAEIVDAYTRHEERKR